METVVQPIANELTRDASVIVLAEASREAAPPRRVLVAPLGTVRSRNGSFVIDHEAAQLVTAAFAEHATDLPIDYEHQSLGGPYSSPNGQAPAAGWIKRLSFVGESGPLSASADPGPGEAQPGLWADVEWTPRAAQQLVNREYRYLSPVVLVRRSDRRAVALHSCALTNKPAIVGVRPVVNRDGPIEREPADLRGLLGLEPSADEETVACAAAERIVALQVAIDASAAERRVARALSTGKLTPAQRDWAFQLALRDPREFDDWLASAPVVISTGRITTARDGQTAPRHDAIARQARIEYRAGGPLLAAICSEDAFVRDALRTTGLGEGVS